MSFMNGNSLVNELLTFIVDDHQNYAIQQLQVTVLEKECSDINYFAMCFCVRNKLH